MSLEALVDIIHSPLKGPWKDRNQAAFQGLFGGPQGRYPARAEEASKLRAPQMDLDVGVPFAAYIHPSNQGSGAYSGLSFACFPVKDGPCLVSLVVGTAGLTPDEAILGRPGHGRKVQAICDWASRRFGHGRRVAWAKHDPTRTDERVPRDLQEEWPEYKGVFDRYGGELYALFRPTGDASATRDALAALLDLLFEERGHLPLERFRADRDRIRSGWFDYLMPRVELGSVATLLASRKYVVLQGPPGTGKTRLARELLAGPYGGFGRTIQFHPNTTYESFIGGLAPTTGSGDMGLRFTPAPGFLMEAAAAALREPGRPYLLHIDEVNRADLGKVLGEALYLLEHGEAGERSIRLAHDFGAPFHRTFRLPDNLHLIGTMNSADRSIAIVDVAVRRRFAFVPVWPRMSAVEELGCELMQDAFRRIVSLFVEHAGEDSFALVPGHSYFLERQSDRARVSLRTDLAPLLEEYLAQGYVGSFAEPVRSYLQWLRSL